MEQGSPQVLTSPCSQWHPSPRRPRCVLHGSGGQGQFHKGIHPLVSTGQPSILFVARPLPSTATYRAQQTAVIFLHSNDAVASAASSTDHPNSYSRLHDQSHRRQLSTPREIAVRRRHCLGLSVDSSSTSSSRDGSHREERTEVEGGLPVLLASLLEEAVDSWSSFLRTITGRQEHDVPAPSSSSSSPRPPIFTTSEEVDVLRRTVRLLSSVSRLDPTLGEEIRRAGSFQSVCSRLIGQINKCTSEGEEEEMMMISEEDSDALVDLQDSVFEIYSPSASARRMEFTNEELRSRLPLVYRLTSVSRGVETQQLQQRQGGGGAYDGDNATIFINQVTRRQSAQADVGFVMWPSAIVLSRWLISNPHIIRSRARGRVRPRGDHGRAHQIPKQQRKSRSIQEGRSRNYGCERAGPVKH